MDIIRLGRIERLALLQLESGDSAGIPKRVLVSLERKGLIRAVGAGWELTAKVKEIAVTPADKWLVRNSRRPQNKAGKTLEVSGTTVYRSKVIAGSPWGDILMPAIGANWIPVKPAYERVRLAQLRLHYRRGGGANEAELAALTEQIGEEFKEWIALGKQEYERKNG